MLRRKLDSFGLRAACTRPRPMRSEAVLPFVPLSCFALYFITEGEVGERDFFPAVGD